MFPTWFTVIFNIFLYGVLPVFLVCVFIDTAKEMKQTFENPVEYEEDFVE